MATKRKPARKANGQYKRAAPSPRRRTRNPSTRSALDYESVRSMGGAEINRRLDVLAKESSRIADDLIAAGRGYERPSETMRLTDPLSRRYIQNVADVHALRDEIDRRYGPGAPSRLPRGFGPIKRAKNPSARRSKNPDFTATEWARARSMAAAKNLTAAGHYREAMRHREEARLALTRHNRTAADQHETMADAHFRIAANMRAAEEPTRNPAKTRAGRPLREGQRVYHCAKRCR